MVIGQWKFEITAKKMLKLTSYTVLTGMLLYAGEACHIKKKIDGLVSSPVAEHSYDPSKAYIKGRTINNGVEDVVQGIYVLDGTEYPLLNDGFPELPISAIKRQPNYIAIREKPKENDKKSLWERIFSP